MKKVVSFVLILVLVMGLLPLASLDAITSANDEPLLTGNQARRLDVRGAEDFYAYLTKFTKNLVAGISSPERQLMAVYDWMLYNFNYRNQRDGAAIDGSKRPDPNEIPDAYFGDAYMAWLILKSGEGGCSNFSPLFSLMASILGFPATINQGNYINTRGEYTFHVWSVIAIDGVWYYFDPQIETGQVTGRQRNNPNWNPRLWWKQPINSATTHSRYDINDPYIYSVDFTNVPVFSPGVLHSGPFFDIIPGDPSYAAIDWAYKNSIFAGLSGNFVPDGLLTRACFTLILHRLERSPAPSPSTPIFPDVDPKGVHYNAIHWAREKGIMGGINGLALPADSLPRYQLITLLYRYHVSQGRTVNITPGVLDRFPDAGLLPSQNDYDAMAWAVTNGIIGGINNRLELFLTTNREMGATVLFRYNNKFGDDVK